MKTLNELFNSGVKFTERKSFGGRTYDWDIGDKKYSLTVHKNGFNETWNITFVGQDANGLSTTLATGQGSELKVFSTVINIINSFIKKNKPLSLTFFAKEGNRSKLYDRMVSRFAKGYTVKKTPMDGDIMYRLSKK